MAGSSGLGQRAPAVWSLKQSQVHTASIFQVIRERGRPKFSSPGTSSRAWNLLHLFVYFWVRDGKAWGRRLRLRCFVVFSATTKTEQNVHVGWAQNVQNSWLGGPTSSSCQPGGDCAIFHHAPGPAIPTGQRRHRPAGRSWGPTTRAISNFRLQCVGCETWLNLKKHSKNIQSALRRRFPLTAYTNLYGINRYYVVSSINWDE